MADTPADETTPEPTLASNRTILKAPAAEPGTDSTEKPETASISPSEKLKVAPVSADVTVTAAEPATLPPTTDVTTKPDNLQPTEAELKQQAEHQEALQKLITEQTYYLPINQLEKRRNTRNAVIGLVCIIVLGLAWADVALDSGIITISGVKAPTHFFK